MKVMIFDLLEALAKAQSLVKKQAEDEGLWSQATTIHEAYLQQALRELHRAVEGE